MNDLVKVGDRIAIQSLGLLVRGTVVTASHWDSEGWDIELTEASVSGGYAHWKEWQDGGKIIEINGKAVE